MRVARLEAYSEREEDHERDIPKHRKISREDLI
jgi:hypothetical protein